MAEGFIKSWTGGKIRVASAGSHPAESVARLAMQVMAEVDIDISGQMPEPFDKYLDRPFDWVITLCDHARDFCPVFNGTAGPSKTLHWSIPDPHHASNDPVVELEAYRSARDDIANRLVIWLNEEFGIKVTYDTA
jgi:arsenate reductase